MDRCNILACVGMLSLLAGTVIGGERSPSGEEIEALIEQLASPNKAPQTEGDTADFPVGYDKAAQDRVFRAFRQLYDLGPAAFPHLIRHLDDERYCMTQDGGAAERNWSVGEICFDILRDYLRPYGAYTEGDGDPRERPHRPDYFEHYKLSDASAASTWWKARKNKSLRELQIETLEWVIGQEAQRPKDYSNEERAYLRDVLGKLRASNLPLDPGWPFAR